MSVPTEAASHADFSVIRYAQCWEDADVLLDGLNIQAGDACLSIASAGDNSFSMLSRGAGRVIAVDLNPAQLECVWLRKAAYATLEYDQFLELLGVKSSNRRIEWYRRCHAMLPANTRAFWAAHPQFIHAGIGTVGKFERYFTLFRTRALPLVHRGKTVQQLLENKSRNGRARFFENEWNSVRWRLMFSLFFSRFVMGRFGRDSAFFKYVEGSVSQRIMQRAKHALVELNPPDNPYLQWILTGRFITALPHALRRENFDAIKHNLDKLEIFHGSIEQYLAANPQERFNRFNLSDIFEYMSADNYEKLLRLLIDHANPGARLVYWNMLVPRSRPDSLTQRLNSLDALGDELLKRDKAFFYSRLVVEEVA